MINHTKEKELDNSVHNRFMKALADGTAYEADIDDPDWIEKMEIHLYGKPIVQLDDNSKPSQSVKTE
jgi:hypothetical protein